MPQVLRWPIYRTQPIPRKTEKLLHLVYLVDHPSLVARGLTEQALEAFTDSLKKSEMQVVLMALIHKDKLAAKRQALLSESPSKKKGMEFN